MKNTQVNILFAFAVILLAGCDDDSSTVSALEWPGMPESFLSESSSSLEGSSSSFAQQSSSSSEEDSSSSMPSSSRQEEVSSSSVHSSSSSKGSSSSFAQSSSNQEKISSSSALSSSSSTEIQSSSAGYSSSEQSLSSETEESSSSTDPTDTPKPKIAYSQTGALVENNNGCVEASGGIVTISCGGTYEFSGSNNNGQIVVNTLAEDSVVHIRLNNLTLKNASDAPFFVISSSRTIVKALEGSTNSFEDAATRSAVTYQKKGKDKQKTDTTGACMYAKDDLTINGKGTLKIVANYKNGIHTSNDLRIRDNPLMLQ